MADAEFAKTSLLDVLIPNDTTLEIEQALASEDAKEIEESSLIPQIEQRSVLYFDEELDVHVVLKTPYQDEATLKTFISRITVGLEAHAVSSESGKPVPNQAQSQARDSVWTSRLDTSEEPVLVMTGREDDSGHDVLLIWKVKAFINRPKVRLQAPVIMFKVSGVLNPPKDSSAAKVVEEYLPSGAPFPVNVLQPISERASSGPRIHLSASRFSRNIPEAQNTIEAEPVALPLNVVLPRRPFRAIPAISSRLLYHKSGATSDRAPIYASLDLDIPVFAPHPIEVKSVEVSFVGGSPHPMIGGADSLPAVCHPHDNLTYLYALRNDNILTGNPSAGGGNTPPSTVRTLDITIRAIALVSERCHPRIEIRWRQGLDFNAVLHSSFMKTSGSIKRTNRPANLPPAAMLKSPPTQHPVPANASAPPPPSSSRAGQPAVTTTSPDMGISITLTAHATPVRVGRPFKWHVLLINRGPRARKLVLTVVPKRRPGAAAPPPPPTAGLPSRSHHQAYHRRHTSRPGSQTSFPGHRGTNGALLADAVVDENILYATIRAQGSDAHATAAVALTPDAQTGVLGPGACFACEMELLPLVRGAVEVDAVRVIDLESGEAVDVRDLPDVVAEGG